MRKSMVDRKTPTQQTKKYYRHVKDSLTSIACMTHCSRCTRMCYAQRERFYCSLHGN